MKNLITLLAIPILLTGAIHAQPGSLDPGFSGDGRLEVTLGIPVTYNEGRCIAVQSDRKILFGTDAILTGFDHDFTLSRYNLDGSIDSLFGTNGIVMTNVFSAYDWLSEIAVQSDGKILAAGNTGVQVLNEVLALVRYDMNGSLDTTFGFNGIIKTPFAGAFAFTETLAIQSSDDKIVLGGDLLSGGKDNSFIVRYKSNGDLDSTFGINGKVIRHVAPAEYGDFVTSIAIQPDGKIVATGILIKTGSILSIFINRFNADGSLDLSFGTTGLVQVSFTGYPSAHSYKILLQPDGKILMAGEAIDPLGNTAMCLGRFNPDGSSDLSFGVGGKVITALPGGLFSSMALQPDGKIIGAGISWFNNARGYALARYNSDGSLDSSFALGGVEQTPIENIGFLNGWAKVVLQQDGKILLQGTSNDAGLILRYLTELNVGVLELSPAPKSVLIYPNPVSQWATLKYELSKPEQVSIQLLDIQGNLLQTVLTNESQDQGTYAQPILIPDEMPKGLYIIRIATEKSQTSVQVVK